MKIVCRSAGGGEDSVIVQVTTKIVCRSAGGSEDSVS